MTTARKYKPVDGPLKWHGGKAYLAKRIIELMPPRCKNPNAPADDDPGWLHYVEPFAGGLSVLLANNPEGISEVVGDANSDLCNFWNVMRSKATFPDFVRALNNTAFSEADWLDGRKPRLLMDDECEDPEGNYRDAVAFFIVCRQSMAGRMKDFAPLTRNRTRRGMNEQASAWLNAVDGLPEVHARLKRVVILNRPALEVIKQQDGPRTLFYLDPPYLHETRATTKEYGEHEMRADDHCNLLGTIANIKGWFLLSGYRSSLYDDVANLHKWRRVDFDLPNNAAGGDTKRRMTECVWMNY